MKYWNASRSYVYGCSQTDSACADCWAATLAHRWESNPVMHLIKGHLTTPAGRWTGALHVLDPKPLPVGGRSRVIAINWVGDLFYSEVPRSVIWKALDDLNSNARARESAEMAPHVYLFLTHRPARMVLEVLTWLNDRGTPSSHGPFLRAAWWGASVTRQAQLHDACEIVDLPGNHWLSAEPLEGPLGLSLYARRIDWVCTGTSTTDPKLQTSEHRTWVELLAADCDDRGVPCWIKQLGKGGRAVQPSDRKMPESIEAAFRPARSPTRPAPQP
jgi:protein gp37